MFTANKNAPNNKDMGDMMAPVHTASSVFTDLELLEQCRQICIAAEFRGVGLVPNTQF